MEECDRLLEKAHEKAQAKRAEDSMEDRDHQLEKA